MRRHNYNVNRFAIISLVLFLIAMPTLGQKKSKKAQKPLTYEELEFMHKIDYDLRHPCWKTAGYDREQSYEIAIAQFEDIFYDSHEEAYRRKTIDRLSVGVEDTSNLIDLVSCYQNIQKKSNYQIWVVRTMLHIYLPSPEPEELDYLLTLSNDKLHALAKTWAQYLKKNPFPPR